MRRLFGSSTQLAAGLVLIGAAGYYLLAVAGRRLDAADASAVGMLYLLANVVGPGIAIPLEQETNRAVSEARARGLAQRTVIRRMCGLGGLLMAAAAVIVGAASPFLVSGPLRDNWGLLLALMVCIATYGTLALVRGVLAGRRQYTGYAVTLVLEGATRLLPLVALDLAGVADATLYGLVFACGGAFAMAGGFLCLKRPAPQDAAEAGAAAPAAGSGEAPSTRTLGAGLTQLLGASLLMQAMANVAPIVVNGRITEQAALAAVVTQAFVLARIPLFLFSPLQSVLLPSLVESVERHDRAGVQRRVRTVLAVIVGIGLAGVVGTAVLGPYILRVFFGAEAELSRTSLAALALGTVGLMAMQVLQPALVAAHRHRWVTWSWAAGASAMAALLFLPGDAVFWAVTAQIAGPVASIAVAGIGLAAYLRDDPAADRGRPVGGAAAQPAGDTIDA
ncbi:lipopolysaccharide biosynthesis protein [Yinghuangia soli]|uniref:O-antigen/teichoic acid export membrane protein n=1 Tax=Yinghuangia soli TaxID=2908204 RepID=A0AA41PVW9_9ACTN|nr:hypothetical protein [Yinghuangia soli]MCF2526825.1 hypothetical protein [Yinghuangia soli]